MPLSALKEDNYVSKKVIGIKSKYTKYFCLIR